jgi:phage gpG-like protein
MFEVHGAERLERILDRLAKIGSRQLFQRMADLMVTRSKQRFITKRDPDDEPWDDWSDEYAATRPAAASLLMDSRKLRNSIEARVAGDVLQIGSEMDYAAAVQAKRPFFGVGRFDEEELLDLMEREVMGAFNAV